MNLEPGVTTPNLAIVRTQPCTPTLCPGADPAIATFVFKLHNGSGHPVDALVDVQGLFADGALAPYRFHTTSANRLVDTRTHHGATPLGPRTTRVVSVPASVAGTTTSALVANMTAVAPTQDTVISLWKPSALVTHPSVSTLNPTARVVVASGALIGLTAGPAGSGSFAVFNSAGTTNLLVDVVGRFDLFRPDQTGD